MDFANVGPGDKVADFIAGTRYFSRILPLAVDPKGHVYGVAPVEFSKFKKQPLPSNGSTPYPQFQKVTTPAAPANDFAAPEQLDIVWISLNYHDLHDSFLAPSDVSKINRSVFAALKPGGNYVVIDHSAEAGCGVRDTDTLHRIDEAAVKSEIEAAGFKLESESALLLTQTILAPRMFAIQQFAAERINSF